MGKRSVDSVLDREFHDLRARILDLAAGLDRIDRAASTPAHAPDRRVAQIRAALESLVVPEPDRAETIQRIFSLDYDPDWMVVMRPGVAKPR